MKPRHGFAIAFITIAMVSVTSSQDNQKWLEQWGNETYIWMKQADTLGQIAADYRLRPKDAGGGGGSYVGFIVPDQYSHARIADFSVHDAVEDELVFNIKEHRTGWNYFFVIDHLGKRKNEPRISPERWKNIGAMAAEVKMIAKEAQGYRTAFAEGRGLPATYKGFRIPAELAGTVHASYSLEEVFKDLIIIRADETNNYGTDFYKIDEKGELHLCLFGEYRPKNR